MDSQTSSPSPPSEDSVRCCNCSCCSRSSWHRSLKRKLDQIVSGPGIPAVGQDVSVARVEIENECAVLRESLGRQQQVIQELYTELEEERNASSSAANEAMSMILRLQREKAEVQMDARQFKRFVEEKMAHDQQELVSLEDVLYRRDQMIQSLTCQVQAYKHRLMSFGYNEAEAEGAGDGDYVGDLNEGENAEIQFEFPFFDYPPLKCNLNEVSATPAGSGDDVTFDLDKYAFGETPREHLQNLEYRIQQLERTPSNKRMNGGDYPNTQSFVEKVAVGQSPSGPRHTRRCSTDSTDTFSGVIEGTSGQDTSDTPRTFVVESVKKTDDFLNAEEDPRKAVDNVLEVGDDVSDRIYTVDSVQTKVTVGACEHYATTPRESYTGVSAGETDIKKLYTRLQALEADRESMRQAIISMRTEKAQLVLLKEIAQQLCKEMPLEKRVPVKKPSLIRRFSLMSMLNPKADINAWLKTCVHAFMGSPMCFRRIVQSPNSKGFVGGGGWDTTQLTPCSFGTAMSVSDISMDHPPHTSFRLYLKPSLVPFINYQPLCYILPFIDPSISSRGKIVCTQHSLKLCVLISPSIYKWWMGILTRISKWTFDNVNCVILLDSC
ncbi:myosin-binding protein 7-like isoform X2 [Magnolia sinica]|uniref:myosin-binding protein 7-like isoform X2 n=1 Tax=Magnolia sinica TaxID=86752 RepID=UPI00265B0EF1|nr:myosin-binding protein 7-like isoform X2 [Magnolia sinica]